MIDLVIIASPDYMLNMIMVEKDLHKTKPKLKVSQIEKTP
jgi:hypothetical protein